MTRYFVWLSPPPRVCVHVTAGVPVVTVAVGAVNVTVGIAVAIHGDVSREAARLDVPCDGVLRGDGPLIGRPIGPLR